MKILLVAMNAKYIHTSLSIRSLAGYCQKHHGKRPEMAEYTINQSPEDVLKSLYQYHADVYLFSTYIWNIGILKHLCAQLIKIRPEATIFFGGPEASYKAEELLAELPFLSGVLVGEGEVTATELMNVLAQKGDLSTVKGLCLRGGRTEPRPPMDMDELSFAYPNLDELDGRILYYESMRGCPFSCSYCLSSVERGVRMRSVPLVFDDLQRFITAQPKQLKFVDRTFNCNAGRARAIWQFLMDHDNGLTNFHFELAGDILDDESIQLLAKAREGLFQFEIGVQSTNPETLAAIDRVTDLDKLANNVRKLQAPQNIHLHLDLIAGLPYEDYSSFVRSFHWVYQLNPAQFQLGFLKVLGGSQMSARAKDYALLYDDQPPFQVLSTKWLTYEELLELDGVAHMVETYRNSGRYSYTTNALLKEFSSPFDFFLKLSEHYTEAKGDGPLSKIGYYEILGSFAQKEGIPLTEELKALCRYDIMLHEKPKKVPQWAQKVPSPKEQSWIRQFYQDPENRSTYFPAYGDVDPKQLSRMTHAEVFDFNPATEETCPTVILFDYKERNIVNLAKQRFIKLEFFRH